MLASGGFGSGKSWALCLKLVMRASKPGAREGLFRKTLVSLKKSTLKTLLEGDGGLPPVLPLGTYTHNKTDCEIKIKGGGSILYAGCDDPAKIGSMNLTGCAIDEVVDLTLSDYQMLDARVRVEHPDLALQIYGVCNPGPPSHHLVKVFGLGAGHRPQAETFHITIGTEDNPFLPESYVANQRESLGVGSIPYRRFFLGEWAGSDGLVYDQWERDLHATVPGAVADRQVIGVDDGYTNPFVIVDMRVDGDGRVHVHRTHYQSKMQPGEKVEAIREHVTDHCEAVLVDPSSAALIDALRDAGVDARPANNEVIPGIRRVQERLSQRGDGLPRLTVDPRCEDVVREFETYEWESHRGGGLKDTPRKMYDHAMDAIRYGVAHIDGRGAVQMVNVDVAWQPFDEDRGWDSV